MTEKFEIVLHVNNEELATILGALRWYQESELWHRDARPDWLDEIVTDGGTLAGLDDDDIDLLVLNLNCGGDS